MIYLTSCYVYTYDALLIKPDGAKQLVSQSALGRLTENPFIFKSISMEKRNRRFLFGRNL